MPPSKSPGESGRTRASHPTSPAEAERLNISLASKLAEKQLRAGTASATVITHYLKLATERERLEKERMISENQLAVAKIEQMGSTEEIKQLYGEALRAMRAYSGQDDGDYYDD